MFYYRIVLIKIKIPPSQGNTRELFDVLQLGHLMYPQVMQPVQDTHLCSKCQA